MTFKKLGVWDCLGQNKDGGRINTECECSHAFDPVSIFVIGIGCTCFHLLGYKTTVEEESSWCHFGHCLYECIYTFATLICIKP